MFFVLDHYRYCELQNKIRSSAYLMASMIQQLGNTKTNKKLRSQDLKNIALASCFNFFHTNSMFYPYPFGITFRAGIMWVKRISANNYTCIGYGPDLMTGDSTVKLTWLSHYNKTEEEIRNVNPDLVCTADNDERIMVMPFYIGCTTRSNFDKSKLGFFVMPITMSSDSNSRGFPPTIAGSTFVYRLVFTPKPGLFPIED